jgi:polyisoprenoid-binding protein YceI
MRGRRRRGSLDDMTTQALPATGTYALDPERTVIRCDCHALLGLLPVHGTFRLNFGRVNIAADPAQSGAVASIATGSWVSGNSARDADVMSAKLLDVRTYPEITFSGTGARADGGSGWLLPGSLTAHGTTRPVEVRVTQASVDGGTARFRVTAVVNRTDFGVTRQKIRTGHVMRLTVDTVGVLA